MKKKKKLKIDDQIMHYTTVQIGRFFKKDINILTINHIRVIEISKGWCNKTDNYIDQYTYVTYTGDRVHESGVAMVMDR